MSSFIKLADNQFFFFWWLKTVTDSRKTLMKLGNRRFCVKFNLDLFGTRDE